MKELIEDYKNKLDTAIEMIELCDGYETLRHERLRAKVSCYRTFITELEAIEKDATK